MEPRAVSVAEPWAEGGLGMGTRGVGDTHGETLMARKTEMWMETFRDTCGIGSGTGTEAESECERERAQQAPPGVAA